jgi:hypothetical protein
MKTDEKEMIKLRAFSTSATDGDEWSASRSGRFISRVITPGTNWIGGWVGTGAKRKVTTLLVRLNNGSDIF